MKEDQLKCAACGHVLNLKDAVGEWIECPSCHARFLIDSFPVTTEETKDNGKHTTVYFFTKQCDFKSFRTQCFDLMMQSSPVDIFSELKVIEEKQCYLPYVSSIGGDSNKAYAAEYVGIDKHPVILQKYDHLSYKNDDKRFGAFCRSLDKGNSNDEMVPVDQSRVAALPGWAAHADELHYYPFYCLVCSYKGTVFSFSSLGDSGITTIKMPKDKDLRLGPSLIDLSNSERVAYAKKAAKFAVAIIALCLLWYFWQEVSDYIMEKKDFISEEWETSHSRNGWFAYVLFAVYFVWLFLKVAFFAIVGGVVSYYASFCILWLAIVVGAFLHNRYVTRRCLKKLKQIQRRKQRDAHARHNICLNELYNKAKDLY